MRLEQECCCVKTCSSVTGTSGRSVPPALHHATVLKAATWRSNQRLVMQPKPFGLGTGDPLHRSCSRQQRPLAVPPTRAQLSGPNGVPPYANMSSTFVRFTVSRGVQPSLIRIVSRPSAAGGFRRPLTAGPLAFVVLLLALVSAAVRMVLNKMASDVRGCQCCRGFGIARCKLCEGRGVVGWEGKWSHFEPCPLCLGRRFTRCEGCGGMLHKPLFRHTSQLVTPETFAAMAPRVQDPAAVKARRNGKQQQGGVAGAAPLGATPAPAPSALALNLLRLGSKGGGKGSSSSSKSLGGLSFGAAGSSGGAQASSYRYGVFMDD